MSLLLFFIFISLLQLKAEELDGYKTYKDYKAYEIKGDNEKILKLIEYFNRNYKVPSFYVHKNKGDIIVQPELASIVEDFAKRQGLATKVIVDDYSEIIRREKGFGLDGFQLEGLRFSWNAYYDIDDIYDYLRNTSKTYTKLAQLIVGGKSFEGRQIMGLRINTENTKKKPVIFIESGIHAREWITPATTTYFINQLLTSEDKMIMELRNDFDWHIFPCVNPDGYHYSHTNDRFWRKTRSNHSNSPCLGADPNRNWDYNWCKYGATHDPCEEVYCGTKAFSEIETKSLSEYISSLNNLKAYIGFHSYANLLLLPYSDSTDHVDNYDDLKKIGDVSLDYGTKINKTRYGGPATAAEILYKASGGSMDWVRYALKTPLVFTYELRGEYFDWPKDRIPEQGDEVTQMLLGLVTEARQLGLPGRGCLVQYGRRCTL